MVFAAALMCAGLVHAAGTGGAAPDMARMHYERQNCHQAYDLLVERLDQGAGVTEAEVAWARAYEDNAASGAPCPAPSGDLAERASNRTVVTPEGLSKLAAYHEQNDGAAYFEAAYTVLTGKTDIVGPEVGFELLARAVELGDPSAQFFTGALHIGGTFGKPSDYAGGFPLIEKAAQAGHVDALFMAGNMYKEGLGTRKDARKAFDFYKQAAERGHIYATVMAFTMINQGEGTRKDFDLAYRLARNVAEQGEVYGAVMAASALLQDKDVLKHKDEALYWMDVAIRDGDETIRSQITPLRAQAVEIFNRPPPPPREYRPRPFKACPMKTVCLVNSSGVRWQCTTNKDYWNDCDG